MDDGIRCLFIFVIVENCFLSSGVYRWISVGVSVCVGVWVCVFACQTFYFRAYNFSTKESPFDGRPKWSSEAEGKDFFENFHAIWIFKKSTTGPEFV